MIIGVTDTGMAAIVVDGDTKQFTFLYTRQDLVEMIRSHCRAAGVAETDEELPPLALPYVRALKLLDFSQK